MKNNESDKFYGAIQDGIIKMFVKDMQKRISLLLDLYAEAMTPQLYEEVYNLLEKSPKTRRWKNRTQPIPLKKDSSNDYNLKLINKDYDQVIEKIISIMDEDELMKKCNIDYSVFLEDENGDDNGEQPVSSFGVPKMEIVKKEEDFPQEPLPNAEDKTLKFKIKIRNITKPPVWREVEVPANYTFEDLHLIIQMVFGWQNEHLWHFERKAYNSPFVIRYQNNNFYDYDDEIVVSPHTGLTSFFKKKDDKLVYIYDFGDDWIHEINMVELSDKRCGYPVLIKSKGDMMIENIGGVYAYMDWRAIYNGTIKLTKKEKKEFLCDTGFDDEADFMDFMAGQRFDLEGINEVLRLEFGGK